MLPINTNNLIPPMTFQDPVRYLNRDLIHNGAVYGVDMGVDPNLLDKNITREIDGKWYCLIAGCGYSHMDHWKVKRHVKHQLNLRQFKCLYCGSCSNRKDNLLSHYLTKHMPPVRPENIYYNKLIN